MLSLFLSIQKWPSQLPLSSEECWNQTTKFITKLQTARKYWTISLKITFIANSVEKCKTNNDILVKKENHSVYHKCNLTQPWNQADLKLDLFTQEYRQHVQYAHQINKIDLPYYFVFSYSHYTIITIIMINKIVCQHE